MGLGVWTAIIGSAVAMLALSFLSSFTFALGGPDSNPSAILAISVGAIATEILSESGAAAPELLPTVFMFLFGSATLCGLLLYFFGKRSWGRYVRFIPHPVVGGFLAGTGYLLLAGGWKMLVGHSLAQTDAASLRAVPVLAWCTAFGVALALLVATRLSRHFLIIPSVLAIGVLAFHLAMPSLGWSLESARAAGLLLPPMLPGDWQSPWSQPWPLVRWDLVLAHGKDFVAMTMVVFITILLNATSLDLATGKDADFDRELKALGWANALGGLVGGLVAVNSFNRSLLNYRSGANSRWASRLCACLVLGVAVLAPSAVSFLPRPVLTGLVLYLGCSLLLNWLWDARRELPRIDYLTVVAILGVVAFAGIVSGVIFGVLVACVGFVLTFARQPVVKQRFTAATRRSNVERTAREHALLQQQGGVLHGFVLQEHLFFGTANSLLEEIRGVLGRGEALLIDFWLVRGLDASAVVVLRKLLRLAEERSTQLVLTGLRGGLLERLKACGLDLTRDAVHLFPDLDRGLEWIEDRILTSSIHRREVAETLGLYDAASTDTASARQDVGSLIGSFFTDIELPAGATLFKHGEASDALYLIVEGRLGVHIELAEVNYTRRLRSYGPGIVLGEMGFYGDMSRSADVIAEVPSRLARLTRADLLRLEREHPNLAAAVHRFVIQTLATRLRVANEELRHLL